jgi:hypothetical protein
MGVHDESLWVRGARLSPKLRKTDELALDVRRMPPKNDSVRGLVTTLLLDEALASLPRAV